MCIGSEPSLHKHGGDSYDWEQSLLTSFFPVREPAVSVDDADLQIIMAESRGAVCGRINMSTPTRVRARVDLEVFGACKHLAAVGKRTRKRLLPGVHANVVDEFVFGFKRLPAAHALVPHADVTQGVETRRDMFGGDVVHQLGHGAESLVADGCRRPPEPLSRRSSVYPFAHQLRFDDGAFGEIQQAVHLPAGAAVRSGGDTTGFLLGRRDDAGSPRVVVPQRRDEAIVPGHYSRPFHAKRGGLPRSCLREQSSFPRK